MYLPAMLYVCLSCGKEREIGVNEAWPTACRCGGTSWTSAPAQPMKSFGFTPIDAVGAANAALRQPGAPRFPAPPY